MYIFLLVNNRLNWKCCSQLVNFVKKQLKEIAFWLQCQYNWWSKVSVSAITNTIRGLPAWSSIVNKNSSSPTKPSYSSSSAYFPTFIVGDVSMISFSMRSLQWTRSCAFPLTILSPTSHSWCYPTTSALVFLSFFSPAPPSPSLSWLRILLFFSIRAHTTSTYFTALSWKCLPPSLSL